MINKKVYKKILIVFVISLATILTNYKISKATTIAENENSRLIVNFNVINAPYNNNEYCEEMLKQNYLVKLIEKPEQSNCYGFPESITINNDGNLNIDTHKLEI